MSDKEEMAMDDPMDRMVHVLTEAKMEIEHLRRRLEVHEARNEAYQLVQTILRAPPVRGDAGTDVVYKRNVVWRIDEALVDAQKHIEAQKHMEVYRKARISEMHGVGPAQAVPFNGQFS